MDRDNTYVLTYDRYLLAINQPFHSFLILSHLNVRLKSQGIIHLYTNMNIDNEETYFTDNCMLQVFLTLCQKIHLILHTTDLAKFIIFP